MASFPYALREIEAEDLGSFARIDNESTVTVASTATITPASGTIDIINMTVTVSSSDIPLSRMSRDDYFNTAVKTTEGQPSMYWVNYESLSPVITLWPVPDAVYTIKYDRLRYTQSVTALSETFDLQAFWMDALNYNLAFRIAEKFNVANINRNEARFRETCEKAKQVRIGRGDLMIYGRQIGRPRRRRV
jgi:hypothetical protein